MGKDREEKRSEHGGLGHANTQAGGKPPEEKRTETHVRLENNQRRMMSGKPKGERISGIRTGPTVSKAANRWMD